MKTALLGNIISISKGRKHAVVAVPSEKSRRFLQIDDLRNNDNVKFTNDRHGIEVTMNDIIIAWDGANAGTVGFNLKGVIGSTLARLRVHDTRDIYPQYLGYFLKSKHSIIRSRTTGATIPHLNREILESLEIPVPSLIRQMQIVQVLGQVQNLAGLRKQTILILDALLDSVFLQEFGSPDSNGSNWPLVRFSDIIEKVVTGKSIGGENRTKGKNEWGVLKVSAVTSGHYQPSEHKAVQMEFVPENPVIPKVGDLLMTRANTRDLVCATCIVDREDTNLFLPDKIWRLDLNAARASSAYIKSVLSHPGYRDELTQKANGTSGSMYNMSQEKFLETLVPLPPIEKQRQYERFYKMVQEQKKIFTVNRNQIEILFDSLIADCFSGRLEFDFDPYLGRKEVDLTDIADWTVDSQLIRNLEGEIGVDVDPTTEEGKIILKRRLELSLKTLEKEFKRRVFTAGEAFSFILKDQEGAAIDYEAYRQLIWRLLDEGRLQQTWHPTDNAMPQMLLEFTDGDVV